ncbi:cyclic peptide export ABC transporter [Pendulispora rubella]|uniref:Cyclic peptide export ABC transporter n=1 Tax=Pendulispora rubella TaxID=2741070 RepID=A0ABZ2LFP4_9BACT
MLALLRLAFRIAPRDVIGTCVLSLVAGGAFASFIPLLNAALRNPSTNLAILFVLACAVAVVTRTWSQLLLSRIGLRATKKLRSDLVAQSLRASLQDVERVSAARIDAALNEDAPAIAHGLNSLPIALVGVVTVMGLLVYVAALDWRIFALALAVMAVGVPTFKLQIDKSEKWHGRARSKLGEIYAAMRQLTLGFKELKLSAPVREEFTNVRLEPAARDHYNHMVRANLYFHSADSWGYVLAFLVIGSIPFGLARYVALPPSVLSGATLAVLGLLGPLDSMLTHIGPALRAGVALGRIDELSRELKPETMLDAMPPRALARGSIRSMRLEDIRFQYESNESGFALGPITREFHAGTITFVVGGNGSGKTTLCKVLCLLYPPTSGRVIVDSDVIDPERVGALRDAFGVLFADYHLPVWARAYSDERGKERFETLVRRFELHRVLRVQDGDVSSEGLSSGQRRRLALILLLLRDHPIYLFDEWTADQDPRYRHIFYKELLPELRAAGKIVIVITHDERYFDRADKVLRLDMGQVLPAAITKAASPGLDVMPGLDLNEVTT